MVLNWKNCYVFYNLLISIVLFLKLCKIILVNIYIWLDTFHYDYVNDSLNFQTLKKRSLWINKTWLQIKKKILWDGLDEFIIHDYEVNISLK